MVRLVKLKAWIVVVRGCAESGTTNNIRPPFKGRNPPKVCAYPLYPDVLATMTGSVSGKRLYSVTETADKDDYT